MKYRITYKVCGMFFTAEAESISRAFDFIRAIIQSEKISFPDQDGVLSEYMAILVNMKNGKTMAYSNFIFNVDAIAE